MCIKNNEILLGSGMPGMMKRLDDRLGLSSKLAFIALSFFVPRNGSVLITCRGKSDGMAAQACAVYSAMLYARARGNDYRHSPIVEADHNEKNDQDWAQQIEDYFCFAVDRKPVPEGVTTFNLDSVSSQLKFIFLSFAYRLKKQTILIEKEHYHEYGNRHPDEYAVMAAGLRNSFYSNKTRPAEKSGPPCLKVACHIRRGDVSEQTHTDRFTSNQQIGQRLSALVSVLNGLEIAHEITMYSRGDIGEFERLKGFGSIRLDGTAFDDFRALVEADILITAKSCFSYTAALLSEGLVIYEHFYHQPLTEWFDCDDKLDEDERFVSGLRDRSLKTTRVI